MGKAAVAEFREANRSLQRFRRGSGDGMSVQGERSSHGKPPAVEARDSQPDAREGQAGPLGVAERSVVPWKPGNAGGGKGPQFQNNVLRAESREIGVSLETPAKVRKLQEALHAKAKGSPGYRFYLLYDKIYRADVLAWAYQRCRENRGVAGVDAQTFDDIEKYGLERWLDELAAGSASGCGASMASEVVGPHESPTRICTKRWD